jgi:hypothetical protein
MQRSERDCCKTCSLTRGKVLPRVLLQNDVTQAAWSRDLYIYEQGFILVVEIYLKGKLLIAAVGREVKSSDMV